MDFLYYGEANVYQENIDAFLAIAEDLELKGLTGKNENEPTEEIYSQQRNNVAPKSKESKIVKEDEAQPYHNTILEKQMENETTVAIQTWSVNIRDVQELDEKVKSMIIKSQNSIPNGPKLFTKASICTVCGKEGLGVQIRNHIEANHLEGVSIPCSFCEKIFRSKAALGMHSRKHSK